jgi:F-type H+-transporting ATPase subunit delta
MKTSKQVKHQARHLFRLCVADGSIKEDRVRQVLQGILTGKRRGYVALANEFERLVKLERLRRTAKLESTLPPPPGIKIRVGSDVYDGSVRAGMVALEKSF